MARKKTETELAFADAQDVARTAVNLKHRINARRERIRALEELTERFNSAVVEGRTFELNPGQYFDEA